MKNKTERGLVYLANPWVFTSLTKCFAPLRKGAASALTAQFGAKDDWGGGGGAEMRKLWNVPLPFILRCEELPGFFSQECARLSPNFHNGSLKKRKKRRRECGARNVLCIFMIPPGIRGQVALQHEARGANGRKQGGKEGKKEGGGEKRGFWIVAMPGASG